MIAPPDAVWLVGAVLAALLAAAVRSRAPIGTDEGYLWYGCQRLREGQAPLRDFRAYEPGRYLWCLPWLLAVDRGVLGLRIGIHAFHGLAVGGGLIMLQHAGVEWPALLALGAVAMFAALPQHKLFEPAIAMLFVGAAAQWLELATPGSAFILGAVVGLAATFGSNLALYFGSSLMLLLAITMPSGSVAGPWGPLALGGLLGASPLLGYIACARGFFAALWRRRVVTIFQRGSSNLPLPVPWPWRAPTHSLVGVAGWRRRGIGIGFVALLALPCAGLAALWLIGPAQFHDQYPALLAAVVAACVTWHHAFSRADAPHLAQACLPAAAVAMIGLQALNLEFAALPLAAAAGAVFMPWFARRRPEGHGRVDAGGWGVWMAPVHAKLLQTIRVRLADAGAGPHDAPLVALPTLIWLLPILRLRSPVHDTFCVYPASEAEQGEMIDELQRHPPRLAALSLASLDGFGDRSFAHTHPRVLAWLRQHYEPVDAATERPANLLLLRRVATAAQVQHAAGAKGDGGN